jgi:hypothetical protein
MSTDALIAEALETAVALAWDGCHKIYILMDNDQANVTRGIGYGSGDGDSVFQWIEQEPDGRARAAVTLRDWWDESCGMRFINTIRTVDGDPGGEFTNIIAQCDEWVEEGVQYMRMPAVNWDDLHVQKRDLFALYSARRERRVDSHGKDYERDDPMNESLLAVIHMIDAMQDIAVEGGAWEFPAGEDDDES